MSGNIWPQLSQHAEPLWTDPGIKSGISGHELISTSKSRRAMNGRTFSPNPRKRGKSHCHQIWISQSPVPRSDPTWLKPCDNKTVQSQIALVSIPVLFMLNNMLSAFWMYLCWNTISCLSLATSISQLWQQWLRIRDSAPFHHVQGCGAWQKTFAYFFFLVHKH